MSRPIRVLVVDDAAFMRRSIVRLLAGEQGVEVVGEAADGLEAVERYRELCPDVICLDIDMPRMSGLTALKHIMSTAPRPIVVVSSMTDRDDVPFEALRLGAIDFFPKPSSLSGSVAEQSRHLLYLIRNAHQVRNDRLRRVPITRSPQPPHQEHPPGHVVAVAGALGSVGSLIRILSELPRSAPAGPSVLFQAPIHPVIADSFRRSISELLGWAVVEVERRAVLQAGTAWLIPSGCSVRVGEHEVIVEQDQDGSALDTLLSTVAERFIERCTAILLAGDRSDGINGLRSAHAAGACCFIQDETSALFSSWEPHADGIDTVDLEQLVVLLRQRLGDTGGPP